MTWFSDWRDVRDEAERKFNVALTRQQLQNDLTAAHRREGSLRDSEIKLVDQINTLRNQQSLNVIALNRMTDERNDWRDAFKLIMKLVK